MALSSYGGYFGAGSNSNTVIIKNFPIPVASGYFGAGSNSNTITIENVSKFIYTRAYDPLTGEPARNVPIKVIWTLPDTTTEEEYYYTDYNGWAYIPARSDVTQADIQYGNASQTVTEPSKGGVVELKPTGYVLHLNVIDAESGSPVGGVKITTPHGNYTTKSNGSVAIAFPQTGDYEIELDGFPRYSKKKVTVSITSESQTKTVALEPLLKMWRSVM